MVLDVWQNLKQTQFVIHNNFYSVLGPLMSSTHSVKDTLKEMSVPCLLYLSELNLSWVCIQFFWVCTECTLSFSVQLSWTCHTPKHIQNWVKLNARVWVYQHFQPKTALVCSWIQQKTCTILGKSGLVDNCDKWRNLQRRVPASSGISRPPHLCCWHPSRH